MRYTAALILAQDEWDITCPIGEFVSKRAAQQALNSAKAWFGEYEGHACLFVAIGQQTLRVTDEQATILELSAVAQARLGPPLDMRVAGNVAIAVAALHSHDPTYMIQAGDFVPSGKTLRDFLNRYSEGYQPDHIADRILPVLEPSVTSI